MVVTTDVVSDMRVQKVADYLLNKGVELEVYGRKQNDSFELENPKFILSQLNLLFNSGFLFYAEFSIRFFFSGLFKKYDVIVSNDLDTLLPCYLLSKIKSADLVYDSHEYFTESVGLQGRKLQKYFWKKIEKVILPRVNRAYTVSAPIKEIYNKKYNVDFKLVRNFPSSNLSLKKVEGFEFDNKKIILYQGVFNPGRNLKTVIQSMQYIEEAVFILIGYGELEGELRNLVSKLDLEDKVRFLGKMNHSEMMNYTYSSDLGIALEEPLGDSFKFSLPNKVFDYTYANLPFVSGGTQEVKKILDNYKLGEIVSYSSPSQLASEISRVLNDNSLLEEIRVAQNLAKVIFTWENECQELNKVYEGLF